MPIPAEVLDTLRQNEVSLTNLDLSRRELDDADIQALVQALAQNTTLTTLDLHYNAIGAAGAQALARNRALTTLDLRYNGIGAAGAQALAQNSTLTSLNLTDNNIGIGTAGAQALAQNSTLKSLNLSINHIGDAGAQALAQNSTLTSLDLSSNKIGDQGVRVLAQNSTLKSLNLWYNQIGDAGAQALAQNSTLIKAEGFELNSTNQSQAQLFLQACGSGDIPTLESLLEQKQVSPYAFEQDSGRTGWHIAVAERQMAVKLFLLQTVANPQSLFVINQKNVNQAELPKESDSTSLYLKAVRAIESYSNATLKNRLLATHHLTSSASSSRLFSPPPTAGQLSSLATAAFSTSVTANETATDLIFLQALKL